MGFFDSKSSSKTYQTTNIDEDNFSLQDTAAPAVLNTGDAAATTVNITDTGIARDAFDSFNAGLDDVFEFAGELAGNLLNFSGDVLSFSKDTIGGSQAAATAQAQDALTAANQISRSDTADTLNTLTKWLAGAAAVSVVAWAFFRRSK